MKRISKRTVAACTVTAAITAGAAVATGAIPGTDGTVHACYATGNGLLLGIPYSKGDVRAVDQGEACRSYEKPLRWNQTGPPGRDATSGYEVVVGNNGEASPPAAVYCPAGKVAVGGGATTSEGGPILGSNPILRNGQAVGWLGDANTDVTVYAICVNAPAP